MLSETDSKSSFHQWINMGVFSTSVQLCLSETSSPEPLQPKGCPLLPHFPQCRNAAKTPQNPRALWGTPTPSHSAVPPRAGWTTTFSIKRNPKLITWSHTGWSAGVWTKGIFKIIGFSKSLWQSPTQKITKETKLLWTQRKSSFVD